MSTVEVLVFVFSVLLSGVLGIVAGAQRLRAGKKAGPRTYALVTIAATVLTMISTHLGSGDRVAAGILTGIGFIGAGMIMHHDGHTVLKRFGKKDQQSGGVEGLTTAAGLWLMTAVGMAVGIGWWWQGVFVTGLGLALLMWNDHSGEN